MDLPTSTKPVASQHRSLAAQLAEKKDRRRVILLYGRDAAQPDLVSQQQQFGTYARELTERDTDVITVAASSLTASDLAFLRAAPYSVNASDRFRGWLIGKDGGVKDHFEAPIDPQRLFREVDRMPMRRQEMKRND